MNNTINHDLIKEVVAQIEMPEGMSGELLTGCLERKHRGGILFRHAKLAYVVTCVIAILMVSMPVYAAYDFYQSKFLAVFFNPNLSGEQIEQIGTQLSDIEGVASVQFVDAEKAWEAFSQEYLTQEQATAFAVNPLADSSSYVVTVRLDADTQAIEEQVLGIDGVRIAGPLKEMDVPAVIFFEPGTTQEQITQVGENLRRMKGVLSVTFTSADEAWETFKEIYLTEELAASFTENPLSDCSNYTIIISSKADVKGIIRKIEKMKGVRKVNHS